MKKIQFIPLLLLLFACNDTQEKQETITNSIMATHDKIMPKTEELMSLKANLDSLKKQGGDSLVINPLLKNLEDADIQMSDWMASYNPEEVKSEELLNYLEQQEKKITALEILTDKSIAEAKAFLQKKK